MLEPDGGDGCAACWSGPPSAARRPDRHRGCLSSAARGQQGGWAAGTCQPGLGEPVSAEPQAAGPGPSHGPLPAGSRSNSGCVFTALGSSPRSDTWEGEPLSLGFSPHLGSGACGTLRGLVELKSLCQDHRLQSDHTQRKCNPMAAFFFLCVATSNFHLPFGDINQLQ